MTLKIIRISIIGLYTHAISSQGNLLQAFYHQGPQKDIIMLYADRVPNIRHEGDNALSRWVFEGLNIAESAQPFVESFNTRAKKRGIHLESDTVSNKNDICVVIEKTEDPCLYTFDSIGGKKGILIAVAHRTPDVKKNKIKKIDALQKEYPEVRIRVLKPQKIQKPCIVIDCGHGGYDDGTQSILGIKEKDIALSVGRQVQKMLKQAGYTVAMTRSRDIFVPLDVRTSNANSVLKDTHDDRVLFISIHANNAANTNVRGVETYCSDRRSFTPLCRAKRDISGCLQKSELLNHDNLSAHLAIHVHEQVLHALREHHYEPIDRKVRRSVSQVLVGAQMPSMLIELGYLSNSDEAFLLGLPEYQKTLARGITAGIDRYLREHCQEALKHLHAVVPR